MARVGKRLRQLRDGLDEMKGYELAEAIQEIKSRAKAKFDETIEIAMNLGVDPRHADQMVRGMVDLPSGTGKTVRVAVFARGDNAEKAKAAGADVVGAEDLAKEVQEGRMDFDRCIATPDMMGVVGRLGKILGPRGMMPNPKLGTVTPDVEAAIRSTKAGAVQFRVEKAGLIHGGVGKASFSDDALAANIHAFVAAVSRAKPSGAKGTYIKKVSLSSTMGPSVRLDVGKLTTEAMAAVSA